MGGKGSGRNRTADYAAMREYKAQGHSMQEVADHFGVSGQTAQRVCKGISPQTNKRKQHYVNGYTKGDFDRDAYATKIVSERIHGFEYVDGFTSSDGSVRLRCKKCGAVIVRSWITVRHNNIACENCKRIVAEEKAKQEEQQRRLEAERKEWAKAGKAKAKQLSFSICKGCGSLFYSERLGVQYCTIDCQKRTLNAIGKDKRLKKMMGIVVDRSITVEKLYEKSNGVCAICGGQCDWSDHVLRDDGTFVVGAMYPSIDHVKPISKGGLHEWDNVQLAHLSCNSKKSNKI